MGAFTILMTMFYANLIVPLFNKQEPLEQGGLRSAIEDFARNVGFRVKNIFVMDGSKRSTKANAYFTGLGAKKRIVLFDTLIKEHTTDELVGVLAHEVGHYKKKHTLSGTVLSLLQIGLMLYIFSLFIGIPELSMAIGAEEGSFHMGALAFGLLYSPISMVLALGRRGGATFATCRRGEPRPNASAMARNIGPGLAPRSRRSLHAAMARGRLPTSTEECWQISRASRAGSSASTGLRSFRISRCWRRWRSCRCSGGTSG